MGESYEEMRRRRIEENKRRMEELNIKTLSQALIASSNPSKPKQSKPRVPRPPVDFCAVRRSDRPKTKVPDYKEIELKSLGVPRRSYKRRDLLGRVYAGDAERADAVRRAENLQSDLGDKFPSFVKPMLQSHVTGGFWLGLPLSFCRSHLPKEDTEIILEDEAGDRTPTKYLADKNGLSAGWRGFAMEHGLVDGDAVVFQLVKPTKFKVYIIRVYGSDDGDKASESKNLKKSVKRARASNK